MKKTENQRLKAFREKLGLTQKEMAKIVELKQGSYADVERAKVKVSGDIKLILNKEFRLNIDWLKTGQGEMFLEPEKTENAAPLVINDRIKLLMTRLNFNNKSFAHRIGVPSTMIHGITKGRNAPTYEVIAKIVAAFSSINPDWLLSGVGPIEQTDPVSADNEFNGDAAHVHHAINSDLMSSLKEIISTKDKLISFLEENVHQLKADNDQLRMDIGQLREDMMRLREDNLALRADNQRQQHNNDILEEDVTLITDEQKRQAY